MTQKYQSAAARESRGDQSQHDESAQRNCQRPKFFLVLNNVPLIISLEATNTGPGFNRGSGRGARDVTSKNGQGHMRVQKGGHFLLPTIYLCVCAPPKVKVYIRWIAEFPRYLWRGSTAVPGKSPRLTWALHDKSQAPPQVI